MMRELIEALGAIADGMRDAGEHDDAGILDRAAAALEAAREDAERLDALEALVAEQPDKSLQLHHGLRPSAHFLPAGLGLSNTGRTLRQAIDKARGKGVPHD